MPKFTSKSRPDFALPGRRGGPADKSKKNANVASRVAQFGDASEKSAVRKKVGAKFPGIGKGTQKKPSDGSE